MHLLPSHLLTPPYHSLHVDLELASPPLVPTLHILFFKPIPLTILPRVYPYTPSIGSLREELITWIAAQGLAGDRLAAEWLLLSSIARVCVFLTVCLSNLIKSLPQAIEDSAHSSLNPDYLFVSLAPRPRESHPHSLPHSFPDFLFGNNSSSVS